VLRCVVGNDVCLAHQVSSRPGEKQRADRILALPGRWRGNRLAQGPIRTLRDLGLAAEKQPCFAATLGRPDRHLPTAQVIFQHARRCESANWKRRVGMVVLREIKRDALDFEAQRAQLAQIASNAHVVERAIDQCPSGRAGFHRRRISRGKRRVLRRRRIEAGKPTSQACCA
jgi:hypothetical protein